MPQPSGMKNAIVLVIFLIPFIRCNSQPKIDSLKQKWSSLQPTSEESNGYYASLIGNEFLTKSSYDSALPYLYKAANYYLSDKKNRAAALNSIGIVFNYKGVPDSSIHYYAQALKIFQQLDDTVRVVITQLNLSIIYKNRGWYDEALETAFDALASQETTPPDRTLASLYNTVGSVYTLIKDYSNAIVFHKKALAIRETIGNMKGVRQSHNNLGDVFIRIKSYDSALSHLSKAEQINQGGDDASTLGSTFNFMGVTYLKETNFQKAEFYLLKALTIKKELGERSYEATALNNLGELKLATGNYKQAELYLNEAEALTRNSSLADLKRNLELKVQLYKSIQNPTSSLKYAEELLMVNDSLLNKEKAESLIAMQLQYETEKKEQQIQLLENNQRIQEIEIETKKTWITGLIIVTVVILIAIMIIYYQYRLVRLNKDRVENLLKEVHHRVKNNLQILASLFSLQSHNLKDETAIQLIKSSESRVNAMAIIHKKLYRESAERTINMNEYVSELILYLTHTYSFDSEKNQLNIVCENVMLDVDKAIPVGLIVNELASNAMKYAFINQPNPILTIQLQQKEDQLNIKIADNGQGIQIPMEDLSTNSFGLKMVNTLVNELKGTLKTQTENGTIFIIQFPNP